jgi:hypothetical protein
MRSVEIAIASIPALMAMKGPAPDRHKEDAYDLLPRSELIGRNRSFGSRLQMV